MEKVTTDQDDAAQGSGDGIRLSSPQYNCMHVEMGAECKSMRLSCTDTVVRRAAELLLFIGGLCSVYCPIPRRRGGHMGAGMQVKAETSSEE